MCRLLPALLCLLPLWALAQDELFFAGQIPVENGGTPLALPWGGGLNCPIVSNIDLDQDGLQDIFMLDRTGNEPVFLLNTGTAGQPQYAITHAYGNVYPFPLLHDWALLRDYNCDGKADIFAYTSGAFAVYRNTSDASGLSFTLTDSLVGSNYVPTHSPNLYVSNVDIPGLADVDSDGDLDILTFSIWGSNFLEYHKNLSMELYGTCDSLVYEVRSRCWGEFQESLNNNVIELNAPCTNNVPNPELDAHGDPGNSTATNRMHSGSTVLPLNLDGDGDMDLLLGDFLSNNLMALTNGGSVAHALMVSLDTLFPVYDVPVLFNQFLAPYHVDIDGDGMRDLVVAPNSTTASENAHGVWYYRNTATDAAPVFQFQQNDLFQGDMLDFGEGARPVLFDHNNDGLMDLVVANEGYFQEDGNYQGRLALLENTGSSAQPAFTLVTTDYAALDGLGFGPGVHPAFGDLDGDTRPDMLLGDANGNLHYFHNSSSGPIAQFQVAQTLVTNDGGAVIDVGANATPQLFDLDGDGLLDLVIGERNGNLNYFRNAGTAQMPAWHAENSSLGGVNVNVYWSATGYSVPFLYTAEDGQMICFSGSESGGLHRYDGITGNETGTWNLTDSLWDNFREGSRTAIVLHDFTGDDVPDAVVGNYRGGLSFWTSSAGVPVEALPRVNANAFTLAPNPARGSVEIRLHTVLLPGMQAELVDQLGRTVRRHAVRSPVEQFSLAGIPSGMYSLRVGNGKARWARRLVVLP